MLKYGDKGILWLGSIFLFLVDQCSKVWALNYLPHDLEVPYNYLFSLHMVFNDSYIMMNHNIFEGKWALQSALQFKMFYTAISALLCVAIIWVINQPALKEKSWTSEFSKTGLFFIVGGTLGNAFDRIFREKGVVDFIRVKNGDYFDFVFNFADLAIFAGEFCILCAWLLIIVSILNNKLNNFSIPKRQSLD